MNLLITAFLMTLWILPAGAHDKGNGGDIILCRASEENPFEGKLSLDYVATYIKSNDNQDLVQPTNWKQSKDRIQAILDKGAPLIAERFKNFTELLHNYTDYIQQRRWIEKPFGVANLEDEGLIGKIPSNCLREEDQLPNVIQAVRRFDNGEQITYHFDPSVLEELKSTRPLQYSMLMLHEFAWDLTHEVKAVRQFNRFIHSTAADDYSKEPTSSKLQKTFQRIGVSGGSKPHHGISQEELDQRLLDDIRSRNADFAWRWLKLGASINARTQTNQTALMLAFKFDQLEIADYLIDQGAIITAHDRNGSTALHYSATYNHIEYVNRLLELGADPNPQEQGSLFSAVYSKNSLIVQRLLEVGADPKRSEGIVSYFIYAWGDQSNIIPTLKLLIDYGADVNQEWSTRIPLDRTQNPEVISLLIEAGAKLPETYLYDILNIIRPGSNCFAKDSFEACLSVTQSALSSANPVDINQVDTSGQTALALAVHELKVLLQEGKVSLHPHWLSYFETMIRHGANPRKRDLDQDEWMYKDRKILADSAFGQTVGLPKKYKAALVRLFLTYK